LDEAGVATEKKKREKKRKNKKKKENPRRTGRRQNRNTKTKISKIMMVLPKKFNKQS